MESYFLQIITNIKSVMIIDFDPQSSLTVCFGYENIDNISTTIYKLMALAIEKKLPENNVVENEETNIRNEDKRESKVNSSDINKHDNISKEINDNISQNNIPISLEAKKNKKAATTKKKEEVVNMTDKEDNEDDENFRGLC